MTMTQHENRYSWLHVTAGATDKALTKIYYVFCPHGIYVFCVDLRIHSDYFLYSINLMFILTAAESVYCAVRTGSLIQTATFSSLKS
jgi:hypothetical protein